MKQIQYFNILKRAFMIAWENKFLWFFGLLVFLGSLISSFNFSSDDTTKQNAQAQLILSYIQKHPTFFLEILLAFIVLIVILFLLRIIGLAAIIKSVNNIAIYRQSKISAIFSEIKKYFWQLVLLDIIIGITLMMVMIVLFIPIAYLLVLKAKMFATISIVVAIIIIVVLIIIASYLRHYAYFYIVLGNMKIKMALEAAYMLLRKNIWESLIMGCIGIALGIVAMMLISALLLSLALLFSPLGFALQSMFAKTGMLIVLITSVIVGSVILLALFSFFTAFVQSSWVLFFQEISLEKKEENKIFEKVEVAEKIPDPEII